MTDINLLIMIDHIIVGAAAQCSDIIARFSPKNNVQRSNISDARICIDDGAPIFRWDGNSCASISSRQPKSVQPSAHSCAG
jgi:hypothetical protein